MGEVIYNCAWYALDTKQQKDVMHLINRKQNGVGLSIGPFATLNNECCYVVSLFDDRICELNMTFNVAFFAYW